MVEDIVVYADILICLNTVVNYLILSVTEKFCNIQAKNFRLILGAFVGAIFSLYIFLPQSIFVVECLVRLTFSSLIVVVSFGCKKIISLFKQILVFYCVTFIYGGIMFALWYILKPHGMVINNGIVYLNISPLILIVLSVFAYVVITMFSKIYKTSAQLVTQKIDIMYNHKNITVTAMVDSGNFLKDTVTNSEIIIVQKDIGEYLFGEIDIVDNAYACGDYIKMKNFRVIPYKTVSGNGIMPAFKCDRVAIRKKDGPIFKSNVLIGVIEQKFSDDYSAIISPSFILE